MNPPFFLTGYPRSRTTWLSNLFTTGNVRCLHDGLADFKSVDAFATALRQFNLGDSDSGLIVFAQRIHESFPTAPWVIVERDPLQCRESLAKFWGGKPEEYKAIFDQLERFMAVFPKTANVLRVKFDELKNCEVVEAVWNHCLGNRVNPVPFDYERCRMLQKLRINPLVDKQRGAHLAKEIIWPQAQQ